MSAVFLCDFLGYPPGCMPSCSMSEFKMITNHERCTPANASLVHLSLVYLTGAYDLKEQYYVYDTDSLIGDTGGYLGLFLGYSFLSIYSVSVEYGQKWL